MEHRYAVEYGRGAGKGTLDEPREVRVLLYGSSAINLRTTRTNLRRTSGTMDLIIDEYSTTS